MLSSSLRAGWFSLGVFVLGACSKAAPKPAAKAPAPAVEQAPPPKLEPASIEQPFVKVPGDLAWLAFGGGIEPMSNQVSLAQDLTLVGSLLDGKGLTLFASGPRAMLAVQDLPQAEEGPQLSRALSKLFEAPGAQQTRYEPATFAVDGPATAEHVLRALDRALVSGEDPLFVYAASHGLQGTRAGENYLNLWGGGSVSVHDVAELLDQHGPGARPTRFVITACFGGGFADLAFVGADPARGARSGDHCGVFAAPWDDVASGCDPNPDRRAQESYPIHFLHALAGHDRSDNDRLRDIDLDGDRRVSLLEAHTWARIASKSFDLPTTTSERFLRTSIQAKETTPLDPLAAPEEVAVVRALGEELELDDEPSARAKLAELERILQDTGTALEAAQQQEDDAYNALRIALLERWPLLDHPWEARTQALLARDGAQMLRMLTESELAQAHRQAVGELDQATLDHDTVRVGRARVLRLVRAFETLRLASALRKKGGKPHAQYEVLRRCERWVPGLKDRR